MWYYEFQNYIARFGHGSAKLARQAQSKEKTLGKMVAAGLTEKVYQDKVKEFYFFDPGVIPPPVIMVQDVSFRYSEDKVGKFFRWHNCISKNSFHSL